MRLQLTVSVLMIGSVALAGEGLKTEYHEAAVNGGTNTAINLKKWTTSRNGKVILVREERDVTGTGTWAQINQIIMVDGKKAVHSLSLEGKRSVIYYPDAQVQVIHADPNGGGLWDRITLLDAKQSTVDIFKADKTGRITPVPDEELAKWQKLLSANDEPIEANDDIQSAFERFRNVKPATSRAKDGGFIFKEYCKSLSARLLTEFLQIKGFSNSYSPL